MTKKEENTKRKKVQDLYALLDDTEKSEETQEKQPESNPIFPDFGFKKQKQPKNELANHFPPKLETYLSPHLLRKMKQTPPPTWGLI